MMRKGWFKWMLVMAALVFAATAAQAADRATRDLVFEDEKPTEPAKEQPAADKEIAVKVKATVLLTREGQTTQVLPGHEFKSGDKVQLVYTTNIDAYVYWLSEGTSGDHFMLYPNPKVGMDNWVKKNQEYMVPPKGNFKFDENKGTEKILLVLAPERIPELEEAAKVAAVKGGTVKDLQASQDTKRKSRDLVFEEQDNQETGVTTMSQVSKDIKQPFVVNFELNHK